MPKLSQFKKQTNVFADDDGPVPFQDDDDAPGSSKRREKNSGFHSSLRGKPVAASATKAFNFVPFVQPGQSDKPTFSGYQESYDAPPSPEREPTVGDKRSERVEVVQMDKFTRNAMIKMGALNAEPPKKKGKFDGLEGKKVDEPAPPQPEPEAQAAWQQVKHPESGHTYYWNPVSGETSWDPPPGFVSHVTEPEPEQEPEPEPEKVDLYEKLREAKKRLKAAEEEVKRQKARQVERSPAAQEYLRLQGLDGSVELEQLKMQVEEEKQQALATQQQYSFVAQTMHQQQIQAQQQAAAYQAQLAAGAAGAAPPPEVKQKEKKAHYHQEEDFKDSQENVATNKLLITQLPLTYEDDDIETLLGPYADDFTVIMQRTPQEKSCEIMFKELDDAVSVCVNLHDWYPGGWDMPLCIKYIEGSKKYGQPDPPENEEQEAAAIAAAKAAGVSIGAGPVSDELAALRKSSALPNGMKVPLPGEPEPDEALPDEAPAPPQGIDPMVEAAMEAAMATNTNGTVFMDPLIAADISMYQAPKELDFEPDFKAPAPPPGAPPDANPNNTPSDWTPPGAIKPPASMVDTSVPDVSHYPPDSLEHGPYPATGYQVPVQEDRFNKYWNPFPNQTLMLVNLPSSADRTLIKKLFPRAASIYVSQKPLGQGQARTSFVTFHNTEFASLEKDRMLGWVDPSLGIEEPLMISFDKGNKRRGDNTGGGTGVVFQRAKGFDYRSEDK